MVTHTKPPKRTELIPGVDYITPEEGKEIFERQARKYMGMSGEEFIRRYRAGEIEDPDRSEVIIVSMLIPFAES